MFGAMTSFSQTVPQGTASAWRMRPGEVLAIDIEAVYPTAASVPGTSREHYAVELTTHSRAPALLQLQTWAHGQRSTMTIDRATFMPPSSRRDWCHTALDAALLALYGELHPTPRLVGTPEWSDVRLSVHHTFEGMREPMRSYELRLITTSTAWWRVHEGAWCHGQHTVALCREDADPAYAVTRLARQAEYDIAEEEARSQAEGNASLSQDDLAGGDANALTRHDLARQAGPRPEP